MTARSPAATARAGRHQCVTSPRAELPCPSSAKASNSNRRHLRTRTPGPARTGRDLDSEPGESRSEFDRDSVRGLLRARKSSLSVNDAYDDHEYDQDRAFEPEARRPKYNQNGP